MKIRFTSIAWTEVSSRLSNVLVSLEFLANNLFAEKDYGAGVAQFVAVAVAIGEQEENEKFSKPHNKSGSNKHPVTGEVIKFISFALQFTQEEVENKNEAVLKKLFCDALFYRLDHPEIRIPKGFNYEGFSSDMKTAISKVLMQKDQ